MLRASFAQTAGSLIRNVCASTRRSHIAPLSLVPVQIQIQTQAPVQRFYATTPKHIRKRNKKAQEAQRTPVYAESLVQLRSALDVGDVPHIAHAYSGVRTLLPLGPQDVAQMAQAVHTALRRLSQDVRQKRIPADLTTFADTLVHDIRARNLPPSYHAHLHLLAFYKEAAQFEKGKEFWAWLVHQDDTYVNAALYGVAIELLAVQGSSAEDTELLYLDALKRFPGYFNEYHLSPEAILPDRTQPINISGISMTLLQGILTARLLHGHSAHAYLTLDTALRLYPTLVPSRFFALFIQERPIAEAYTVFNLACRAGSIPGPDALKMLLGNLRQVAAISALGNAALLRSMLTASYAYMACGGTVTSNHLNELVIGVTGLLKSKVVTHMTSDQRQQVTDEMLDLVQQLFAVWSHRGSRPGIAAFNSTITNIAGRGGRGDLIPDFLNDIRRHDLEPNIVTHRSILNAAGDIGESDLVHSSWTDLVAFRIANDTALDLADWQTLAKAGKKANMVEYVQQQLINFEHVLTPVITNRITGLLNERMPAKERGTVFERQVREILGIIDLLKQDVKYMTEQVEAGLFRDFHADPLPLHLEASSLYKDVPEQHIRAIYDEMTTVPPSSPTPSEIEVPEPPPPAMSSTSFRFDELRYQNWKSINVLLFEAEKHDLEYMTAVDEAIRNKTLPPKRDMGLNVTQKPSDVVGLSNLKSDVMNPTQQSRDERTFGDIRQEIYRLRGRTA